MADNCGVYIALKFSILVKFFQYLVSTLNMYVSTWVIGTDNCASKIIKHKIFCFRFILFWENVNEGD
jgi:hypothetical protein